MKREGIFNEINFNEFGHLYNITIIHEEELLCDVFGRILVFLLLVQLRSAGS